MTGKSTITVTFEDWTEGVVSVDGETDAARYANYIKRHLEGIRDIQVVRVIIERPTPEPVVKEF